MMPQKTPNGYSDLGLMFNQTDASRRRTQNRHQPQVFWLLTSDTGAAVGLQNPHPADLAYLQSEHVRLMMARPSLAYRIVEKLLGECGHP